MPCSPYMNRRFGGTYRLHLQGPKSAEQETSVRARRQVLHGAISQKKDIFITTAVKISNPTSLFAFVSRVSKSASRLILVYFAFHLFPTFLSYITPQFPSRYKHTTCLFTELGFDVSIRVSCNLPLPVPTVSVRTRCNTVASLWRTKWPQVNASAGDSLIAITSADVNNADTSKFTSTDKLILRHPINWLITVAAQLGSWVRIPLKSWLSALCAFILYLCCSVCR
jgi:hypothetical protein